MVEKLSPAARAFDSIAESFDSRFRPWLSVAAQRRQVRDELLDTFPRGASILELGGGTGEDAAWLIDRGRRVLLTDASPKMVGIASAKLASRHGGEARVADFDDLVRLAGDLEQEGRGQFDGAYSNFAALNCVADLKPAARDLARMLRPGAPALLVLFGTCSPGEMLVEALRGRPKNMFRRFAHAPVPARVGGKDFTIHYHRSATVKAAMAPWFAFERRRAIGLFVPPSAAEPAISRYPRLLTVLETLDRRLARRFAALGDHVAYRFVRTNVDAEDV